MPLENTLASSLLLAMPGMDDPNFSRTAVLVCQHDGEGAMGVVLNRRTDVLLGELFEQLGIEGAAREMKGRQVLWGGPVQVDRGFVLHKPIGSWQSTLQVRNDIGLTTSKDILTALGQGEGPTQVLITIGYAGWSAGQLENEIRQNAWLTVAADASTLFDTPPEGRMSGALGLLGIDLSRLSEQAGHA